MNKIISMLCLGITFAFFTCYGEAVTDNLPKEFYDNAELYSKLEMIENLTVIEKISDRDLQVVSQKSDDSLDSGEDRP